MIERQAWLGFNLVAGIGPVRTRQLLERFGSLADAWQASPEALSAAADVDARTLQNFVEVRRRVDLDRELARIDQLGVSLITWQDEEYPSLLAELRAIDEAPPLLYSRGSLTTADESALAVVGTRKATPYGLQVTQQFARKLAARRLTIVSGLARGIDTEAHRAALEVDGRTIAVLPGGIDVVFPPQNRALAEQIAHHGALVTSFPLGTQAESKNFPPRNALISGLARGVLVTEASVDSGAMLTVTAATRHGRDVFAVPGNITAHNSAGVNQLIRDGAVMVMEAQDVLDVLKPGTSAPPADLAESLPDLDGDEKAVFALLSDEPIHIDDITRQCAMPVARISSALTLLELKGLARQVAQSTYVRTSKVR